MMNVNGTLNLNQLTDAQVAKVYGYKAAHEGSFNIVTNPNQQYGGAPNSTALQLQLSTPDSLDLINSLVKELLKT